MTRKKMRFSKCVIVALLASVAVFTAAMTVVFCVVGTAPDALIYAFFGFVGAEAGVLGMLKSAEEKSTNAKENYTNEDACG